MTMHLAINRTALTVLSILCAVLAGYCIGAGGVFIPTLLVLGITYWLFSSWLNVPLETPILAILLFGYMVGNRGFAQLTTPGLPIFVGELGLAITGTIMALRIPLHKELPFNLNTMGLAIVAWIITSSFHLIIDLRVWGFYALRDYAMVYYAAFFFVGQSIALHRKARSALLTTLTIACWTMPISLILYLKNETFFLQTLTYSNNPIIYYKGDLVGIFGVVIHLYCFFLFLKKKNVLFLIPSVMGLVAIGITSARAAFICLVVGAAILILARVQYYFRFIAIAVTVGLACLICIAIIDDAPFHTSKVYGLYEHVISLADLEGKHEYKNPDSINTGDNNRYRLVWWKVMVEQTLKQAPIFGLGFGYNLANPFLEEYYLLPTENFYVRSPHNFLLTVFGRTGLLGIGCIVAILVCKASYTIRLINDARTTNTPSTDLILYVIAWTIFTGACFGVVLEGPMGAIPFWLLLGMAHVSKQTHPQET